MFRSSALALTLALTAGSPVLAQSVSAIPPLPIEPGWRAITPQPLPYTSPQFSLQSGLQLRAGEVIGAALVSQETLYLGVNETRSVSFVLSEPLRDRNGLVVVPQGSVIEGQFQPAPGGSRFVSRSVVVNGRSFPLYAQSEVIRSQKDPRQTSGEAILSHALMGAGVGLLLGGITGDRVIATEEVLGAAALGAVVGNVTAAEMVVVQPNQPMNLTITQDVQLLLP
ncbi:MAG: hypothetical protein Q6J68_03530 [Thermostichales cyanobacterium SZTDM-1c_bins_54]